MGPSCTVSLPFDWNRARDNAEAIKGGKTLGSFRQFSGRRRCSEMLLDGGYLEALAETLSPKGKLFEIYFVRLIGTPNQQFKKRMSASAGIQVSSS